MSKQKTNALLFSIGAVGYGLLEILWRGHTHWSMLGAGGICFVFFGNIGEKIKKSKIIVKAIIGSAFITSVEFIFGIIFNIILKKNVWNYSKMPLNIGGQICLLYSFFWALLSILCFPMAVKLKHSLETSSIQKE